MTLNQLVNQLNQIAAENPQAEDLPVHETYYVSRGQYNRGYYACHEVQKVIVGNAEVFVRERRGVYRSEKKPAVILKIND